MQSRNVGQRHQGQKADVADPLSVLGRGFLTRQHVAQEKNLSDMAETAEIVSGMHMNYKTLCTQLESQSNMFVTRLTGNINWILVAGTCLAIGCEKNMILQLFVAENEEKKQKLINILSNRLVPKVDFYLRFLASNKPDYHEFTVIRDKYGIDKEEMNRIVDEKYPVSSEVLDVETNLETLLVAAKDGQGYVAFSG